MRPVFALFISVCLFAGVWGYTRFADSVLPQPIDFSRKNATEIYTVQVLRTFDCVGDPDFDVESFLVTIHGDTVINRSDHIPAGEEIFSTIKDVRQKSNQIYVLANLEGASAAGGGDDWTDGSSDDGWDDESSDDGWDDGDEEDPNGQQPEQSIVLAPPAGAMRILVTQGERTVADQTFWLEEHAVSIQGTVSFEAPAESQ